MNVINKAYVILYKIIRKFACGIWGFGLLNARFFEPRHWSNDQLRQVCDMFSGDVINVSGWKDEDREGKKYRDYFSRKSSYTVTNWGNGERGGLEEGDVQLDLEGALPEDLVGKFDVVFNHTTLEHIYDIRTAFRNICSLSRDAVVLVIPFAQAVHYNGSFKDYWRPTPFAVQRLFGENGFILVGVSSNDRQPFGATYAMYIAVKDPGKYADKLREHRIGLRYDLV
ncbi:MAG TPA: hypothetical protein VGK71_07405 [Nitrospirota bacterium]